MQVRKADFEDIPHISRIYAQSWKAAYVGMVPQDYLDALADGHWVEAFQGWFSAGLYEALLVCEDSGPVGCAAFGPSREAGYPAPEWAEIQSLYLLPAFFSRGYGARLFRETLGTLRAAGYRGAYLWALRENERARRFYRRFGFRENGECCTVTLAGRELTDDRFLIRF